MRMTGIKSNLHGTDLFDRAEIHDRPEILLHVPQIFGGYSVSLGYACSVHVIIVRDLILIFLISERQRSVTEIAVYRRRNALSVLK